MFRENRRIKGLTTAFLSIFQWVENLCGWAFLSFDNQRFFNTDLSPVSTWNRDGAYEFPAIFNLFFFLVTNSCDNTEQLSLTKTVQ